IKAIGAWEAMLARLGGPTDPDFVDWIAVDRSDAREFDIALHRRYLDPMKPFAQTVLEPAHGVMLTSATLRDGEDWGNALERSGAAYIPGSPVMTQAESPFDYANRAEVLIITDIRKGDLSALAGAYSTIIEAFGCGVLGLFTALWLLRAVLARLTYRLASALCRLYS